MTARQVGDLDKAIGRRLKICRLERGMSQSHLGDLLGVTFQQIQKYENGANRFGAGRLQEIAEALKVPTTFFFGEESESGGGDNLFPLIETALSLRLLKAFNAISDRQTKRLAVDLLENIAEREIQESQR